MEQTLQQKQLAFLEETVSFYNSNNRSVIMRVSDFKEVCKYFHETLPGCAIGRHVEDKELCKMWDSDMNSDGVSVTSSNVFSNLPDNLKELDMNFLHDVQRLHDERLNWDDNGLSERGKGNANTIKYKFGL